MCLGAGREVANYLYIRSLEVPRIIFCKLDHLASM
jgi:hypothetical protein